MGEKRNVYRLLVGKPEGKRPLGRLRRRWIDNIKMDLLFNSIQFIHKFHGSNLGNKMPDGYKTSHIQCSQSKQCDKKKI
jgi:hypothetical protein